MKRVSAVLLMAAFILLWGCAGAGGKTPPEPPEISIPSPDPGPEPAPPSGDSPQSVTDPVEELISGMALEEKVGQMFFIQCPAEAEREIEKYAFGGVLLFSWNVEGMTAQKLSDFTASMQAASGIPLFIGTDEEGGTVTRISSNPNLRGEKFKSPRELYASGGWETVENSAGEMSQLLTGLGININFAPVCDISTAPGDFMYSRSIGLSPEDTALFTESTVEIFSAAGLGSVLKHFPGYGSNGDTHTGRAIDQRDMETFRTSDFVPFRGGIAAGATMVMMSHNTVVCMDPSLPASLSPEVNRVLREELGFDGVVITDDLTMSAVGDMTDSATAAVLAVAAGNDMICCADYAVQIPAVIAAVKDGTISEGRIDESVHRILAAKIALGIIPGVTDNADY